MRWVEHWDISKDCLGRSSLMYQLGSVMPDWFMRCPIHRWTETRECFEKRVEHTARMKDGWLKDWNLGVLAHFIEDYCCNTHNEEYYNFYKHRVFEVREQKLFRIMRQGSPDMIKHWKEFDVEDEFDNPTFTDISAIVDKYVNELHVHIKNLRSQKWYTDMRIMQLDMKYAYALLLRMLSILSPNEEK